MVPPLCCLDSRGHFQGRIMEPLFLRWSGPRPHNGFRASRTRVVRLVNFAFLWLPVDVVVYHTGQQHSLKRYSGQSRFGAGTLSAVLSGQACSISRSDRDHQRCFRGRFNPIYLFLLAASVVIHTRPHFEGVTHCIRRNRYKHAGASSRCGFANPRSSQSFP